MTSAGLPVALLKPEEILFKRQALRVKAKDLARILGICDAVVSRWENHKATIDEGDDRLWRSIFLSSALPCLAEHECTPGRLDVLRALPLKRKEFAQSTTIKLNPQERQLLDAVCSEQAFFSMVVANPPN